MLRKPLLLIHIVDIKRFALIPPSVVATSISTLETNVAPGLQMLNIRFYYKIKSEENVPRFCYV